MNKMREYERGREDGLDLTLRIVREGGFLEKVSQTHKNNKHALVYRAAVELAKLQIDLSDEAPEEEE